MKKIRIFALIAACVMFLSAYLMIKNKEEEEKAQSDLPEETVMIRVVAAADLKPYTVLNPDLLSLEEFTVPAGTEKGDWFETVEEVSGLVVYSDIFKGEVVTSRRALSPDDERLGLAMQIRDGMRAVTIKVDSEQALGYNLQVGNRVDIIYLTEFDWNSGLSDPDARVSLTAGQGMTLNYGEGNPANVCIIDEDIGTLAAVTAVQNVRVAAVARSLTRKDDGGEYSTVTLEVTPEDASLIALMEKTGTIRPVLRSPEDHEPLSYPRTGLLDMFRETETQGMDFYTAEVSEPETEEETGESGETEEES